MKSLAIYSSTILENLLTLHNDVIARIYIDLTRGLDRDVFPLNLDRSIFFHHDARAASF